MKAGKRSKRLANQGANIQALIDWMRIAADRQEQSVFTKPANKVVAN